MMTKRLRVTPHAAHAIQELARWTLECFGPQQASAYEEHLILRCLETVIGFEVGQDCRGLIDPELHEDLRFLRAGQHFVVFVQSPDQIVIIDVLHARTDLPRRLAGHNGHADQDVRA
jgi:toxin ParE1/3/4